MNKNKNFKTRKKRVRVKIYGTKEKPRLTVTRSNRNMYAQLIDDDKHTTLLGMKSSDLAKSITKGKTKKEEASLLGEEIAKSCKKKKIERVVFDRSGYKYHGRVKAFAESARKGGLGF